MPQQETGSVFAKKQIVLGLITVFSIYFAMSYMVQTIIAARPRMTADLNGMSLYSWLLSIPSLAAAFVTLLFSKLSDMYGRRIMMLISMIVFFIGTILSALSPTFPALIAANALSRVGSGGVWPLCFAVLGDMFPPGERSKWVGMLNIPQGFFALCGPMLGGWIVDSFGWRYLYWLAVPLILIGLLFVPAGIPSTKRKAGKIDMRGAVLVAVASSATILGLSFAGIYSWGSIQVIGLLGIALLFWIFFFRVENAVDEPIMDPQVFRNRTILTVSISGILSFIGLTGVMMYFPMFLQGVQGMTVTKSGLILTPNSLLMAFIGVPTGFILARTKRYKWIYIASYGLLTAVMAGIAFFNSATPVYMAWVATTFAGLGLGALPTVNTLVVQYAVPKRLLGVSLGASLFSITMGMAIASAVLQPVMNDSYARTLQETLPGELHGIADEATIKTLGDPKAVLSPKAMKELEATFRRAGSNDAVLFGKTVKAIRTSMAAGVRSVFILGAVTMLMSFLLILTVPEISMDAVVEDKKMPKAAVAKEAAV